MAPLSKLALKIRLSLLPLGGKVVPIPSGMRESINFMDAVKLQIWTSMSANHEAKMGKFTHPPYTSSQCSPTGWRRDSVNFILVISDPFMALIGKAK